MDPFTPPAVSPGIAWPSLRWLGRFGLGRALRVTASGLVLGVCATLVWPGLDRDGWLALGVVMVVLWAPTTWTLLRVRLFPGPADSRLRDEDGNPSCPEDRLSEILAWHTEYLLGTVPALLMAVWLLLSNFAGIGWGLGIVLGTWTMVRLVPIAPRWATSTAMVLLQVNRPRAARSRLEPWARLPWRLLGPHRDGLLLLLATARFRTGDIEGATHAIDGTQRLKAADVQRAAILAARDPETAQRLATQLLSDDDPSGLTLQALGAWHETPPAEVPTEPLVTALESAEAASPDRILALVTAAALAREDRDQARTILRKTGWTQSELETLSTGWPGVTARLNDPGLWH